MGNDATKNLADLADLADIAADSLTRLADELDAAGQPGAGPAASVARGLAETRNETEGTLERLAAACPAGSTIEADARQQARCVRFPLGNMAPRYRAFAAAWRAFADA